MLLFYTIKVSAGFVVVVVVVENKVFLAKTVIVLFICLPVV